MDTREQMQKAMEAHAPAPVATSAREADFGLPSAFAALLKWLKFPGELFGVDLKVALESTYPKGHETTANPFVHPPRLVPSEMFFRDTTIDRYYHPAVARMNEDGVRTVLFVPRFTKDGECFKRLVFRRKMRRDDPECGRYGMMFGRHEEEFPFGFSCWKAGDKGNSGYVSLAYPGIASEFVPVFARVETSPMTTFLKIEAEDIEHGVLVTCVTAPVTEVPENLK